MRLFGTNTAYRLFQLKLKIMDRIPLIGALHRLNNPSHANLALKVMGMDFSSPLGLGAGIDKEGQYYNSFSAYGFSFVIIGPADAAGIMKSIEKIKVEKPHTVLAMCLSKDHLTSFSLAYDFADMFILDLSDEEMFDVAASVLDARLTYETSKPVLLRIGREYSRERLDNILDFSLMNGIDGFVVGSLDYVRKVNEFCRGRVPIIGYGKIRSNESAKEMLDSGASLIAITTGLLLDGPSLIKNILKYLDAQQTVKSSENNEAH